MLLEKSETMEEALEHLKETFFSLMWLSIDELRELRSQVEILVEDIDEELKEKMEEKMEKKLEEEYNARNK